MHAQNAVTAKSTAWIEEQQNESLLRADRRSTKARTNKRREAMNDELTKPDVAEPLLAKRPSMTVTRETTYRVSKAQSLRMRAYDKKVEAAEAKAEAKKAKAALAQKTILEAKPASTDDASTRS